MSLINRQYKLAARPLGLPKTSDWSYSESPTANVEKGQFLVKSSHISLDPAMRGWMNDGKSYIPPVGIDEVMRAGAVGVVVESQHDKFQTGDTVVGMFGVQDYALSDGKGVQKVDPSAAPLPVYLGTLGMPGMTAYFGLLEVGQCKAGDTVVMSGAAGAVGSVAGQIAKIKGCRVVGIAGGADKCRFVVDELGFDACIDYKNDDLKTELKTHCPKGVDLYFDNVGGEILDTVLTQLAMHARIVVCGAISQYNNTTPVKGPSNYLSLLVNRASMTGMVVFDWAARYGEAVQDMVGWLAKGELKSKEHVVNGIENFPEALLMLFEGKNLGKLVLKLEA
ncbi:MAG: NADP-dependent oxidoreductase [Oceanococcus sp.]